MILIITSTYRFFRFGERITWDSVSEDGLNFYLHGWNDRNGWSSSNYLVLPKYAAMRED